MSGRPPTTKTSEKPAASALRTATPMFTSIRPWHSAKAARTLGGPTRSSPSRIPYGGWADGKSNRACGKTREFRTTEL